MVGHGVLGLVEAVVFDLDDTLFDHTRSTRRALDGWLQTLGVAVSSSLAVEWSTLEARHFEAWRAGAISFEEQRRRRLRDFLPLIGRPVGADAELDSVFAGYLHCYEESWQAFDDARPALDELVAAGLVLAVLTNGTAAQQQAKVERIGLVAHLAAVVTSEELGVAKPAPQAYLATCRRIGSDPTRTLHVGDRHDLDVVAARAAGLPALHLDRLGGDDEPPEGRLRSLTELAPRLGHGWPHG
jgi:putative hydrolase of the HAD superfamily